MKQAILAVSFGTTYPDTLEKTIAATEAALAEAYPGWPVYRAFTSGIILKKLRQRDGVEFDNVARPWPGWSGRAIPRWRSSPPM